MHTIHTTIFDAGSVTGNYFSQILLLQCAGIISKIVELSVPLARGSETAFALVAEIPAVL